MPKFEVHIPASPGGFSMTLKVSADNWMAALKAGMQKLGEQGASTQNVMVDVQDDNSIHVTEATSGRVFRIRELSEEEAAAAPVKRPSQIRPAPTAAELAEATARLEKQNKTEPARPATIDKTQPLKPATAEAKTQIITPPSEAKTLPPPSTSDTQPPTSSPSGISSSPSGISSPSGVRRANRPGKSSPRIEVGDVQELEHPVKPVTGNIGRPKQSPQQQQQSKQNVEDLLADIFLRVNELQGKQTIPEAMQYVLDLAMEKVPCESGSVFRADAGTGDLSFIAARGPKANEILKAKIVVPAGTGIAGFCATEGVSLALSDVQKDPRFYAAVGEKVDYETKSMLCSPMMTHGRSFGCMQLINRKGGPQFLEHEVGVLSYLSHQAALFLNRQF